MLSPGLTITRRTFLSCASFAAGSAVIGPFEKLFAQQRTADRLVIRDVIVWQVEGERVTQGQVDSQYQVQPLHIYPEHRPGAYRDEASPKASRASIRQFYLEITTEEGLSGLYGPIDREAAIVIDRVLKDFLIGKDALGSETLWDKLYRLNRHSRAGHYMMGLSAVDNALWDLRGRYYQAPVYRLLGGSRHQVEVYGSTLGFRHESAEKIQTRAVQLKQEGFRHQKWFFVYGPSDGPEGLRKNVELVRILREAVGDDVDLMFDAFMGWTLPFATLWAQQAEQYRPRWLEEAFPPNQLEAFVSLSRTTKIPLATGEHFYNRWEVLPFLQRHAIQVVQADPEWCGGVTELVKICALASAYGAQVVPHGHSLHAAMHVVASQSPAVCPLVEYLINKMRYYYHFEKHPLRPENGWLQLPDRPGFGIELDDAKVNRKVRVHWQEVTT